MPTDIARCVRRLAHTHQTAHPFQLCSNLNILVMFSQLPEHVKGFTTVVNNVNVVFLNRNLSDDVQRIVCAHELGHILLHGRCNGLLIAYHTNLLSARLENEADLFCACLLLPEEWFGKESDFSTLEQIAAYSGLPLPLVQKRAELLHAPH